MVKYKELKIDKLIIASFVMLFIISCQSDCAAFKNGTFMYKSLDGSISKIVRNGNRQIEYYTKSGREVQLDLKWTSDCSYKLFNRKLLKGPEDRFHHFDTTYFEISPINKNTFIVRSRLKGIKKPLEIVMTKIE